MDMKAYYEDLRREQAGLEQKFPDGVVYVTSLFHRERNSTPGRTVSATHRNAARVITDGTHRVATDKEVKEFLSRQDAQHLYHTKMEQQKKQQFVVVTDANLTPVRPADNPMISTKKDDDEDED